MPDTRPPAESQVLLPFGVDAGELTGGPGSAAARLRSTDARTRLSGWQTRLNDHFARLATTRKEAGWPLFALEHGLGVAERSALMTDVRACAAVGPTPDVPLPWIVYAAEIGYEYSGYEYWQTFESKTPRWQFPWREQIRSRFVAFAKKYHGAVPEGDWARHFNIIAWPITHGILPRDLQRQLAELLYRASMSFDAETFASAVSLGRKLQSQTEGCSSRFRQFAENEALLGHIALALLLQHEGSGTAGVRTAAILHANTLSRIVADLSRERDAGEWLAKARTAARSRVKGLAPITLHGRPGERPQPREAPRAAPEGGARVPRQHLILREGATDHWQVRLRFPNLAMLLTQMPRARDVLTRMQGRVGGASGPILARGRIITEADPTVILSSWPAAQAALLTFDGAPPELASLLTTAFRMEPGDRWLFLIGSDGQARQISSNLLRPGEAYVLLKLTETRNPVAGVGVRTISVGCRGIYGLRIDVPRNPPEALVAVADALGLTIAQTLEAWPAGLPAAVWGGDGTAVWLAGQAITLGTRVDARVEKYSISVDGEPEQELTLGSDVDIGDVVFLQVPPLAPGDHRLALAAHTPAGRMGQTVGERCGSESARLRGELSIHVRERQLGTGGYSGALSFAIYPRSPSLEDVWEDRVEVHVAVPAPATLRCRLLLRDSEGEDLFNRAFPLESPCDSDGWRRQFAAIRDAAADEYDEAQACVLEFDGSALGRATVVAERDFRALRWAVRANGNRAVLIDSEGNSSLRASLFRCASPALEVPIDAMSAERGVDVDATGALMLGRTPEKSASVVVVPPQHARGFAALGLRPEVALCGRSQSEIHRMLSLALTWEQARIAGSALARVRQQQCVQALVSSAFGAMGGRQWETVEAQVRTATDREGIIRASGCLVAPAKSDEGAKQVFARRLMTVILTPEEGLEAAFVGWVRAINSDDVAVQCARFAFRLSKSPAEALDWSAAQPIGKHDQGDALSYFLNAIASSQFVVRGMRYVYLMRSCTRS